LPDWRNPKSYGSTKSWSHDRWRWEFTRRREDYRKDFETTAAATIEKRKTLAALFEDEKYDPEDLDPESSNFIAFGDDKKFQKQYGINLLVHPKYDFEKFPFAFSNSSPPAGLWVGFGQGVIPRRINIRVRPKVKTMTLPEGFAALVVDLTKQLKPQIKEMMAQLLTVQAGKFGKIPSRRKHENKWFTYLRVLDGRAAEAKLKELASITGSGKVGNPEQNALQVWDAARHLMFNWPA
jgi:hypothetical protein